MPGGSGVPSRGRLLYLAEEYLYEVGAGGHAQVVAVAFAHPADQLYVAGVENAIKVRSRARWGRHKARHMQRSRHAAPVLLPLWRTARAMDQCAALDEPRVSPALVAPGEQL